MTRGDVRPVEQNGNRRREPDDEMKGEGRAGSQGEGWWMMARWCTPIVVAGVAMLGRPAAGVTQLEFRVLPALARAGETVQVQFTFIGRSNPSHANGIRAVVSYPAEVTPGPLSEVSVM